MKTTLVKERITEILEMFARYEEHDEYHSNCDNSDGHINFDDTLATQALEALVNDECIKARIDGAQALADRIHKHRPLFHMPNKCKLCAVVDGHLDILKRELRATESPRKKGGVKDD